MPWHTFRQRYRHTDRYTNSHTDTYTDRHTDPDRLTDTNTDRYSDIRTDWVIEVFRSKKRNRLQRLCLKMTLPFNNFNKRILTFFMLKLKISRHISYSV